jgi:molybdopterin-guanine dinucleotide biosynthesis protein A
MTDRPRHGGEAMKDGIPVVILAGGQGSRLGTVAKGLLKLGDVAVLDRIVARLAPQASTLLLNLASGDTRYAGFDLAPLPDEPGFAGAGPLAGLLAALDWAQAHGHARIATVPVDTPFLPPDLLARLEDGGSGAAAAYAVSNGRQHPVVALWRADLAPTLRAAMTGHGLRRMYVWLEAVAAVPVVFAHEPVDPFFNVNTPDDLAAATRIAAAASSLLM